jgi:hypothetical protein
MHRHSTTATPELQRDLKQNFEAALGELRQDDPKIIARRKPIVQRQRFSQSLDPKNQALTVASTALSALWGV